MITGSAINARLQQSDAQLAGGVARGRRLGKPARGRLQVQGHSQSYGELITVACLGRRIPGLGSPTVPVSGSLRIL